MAVLSGQAALDYIKNGGNYEVINNGGNANLTGKTTDYGFLDNLAAGLIKPFVNVGTKSAELGNFLATGLLGGQGGDKYKPQFMTNNELQNFINDPSRSLGQDIAGVAAFGVPFGGTVGSAALGGAGAGALSSFANQDLTKEVDPGQILSGALLGGVMGGGLKFLGNKLSNLGNKKVPEVAKTTKDVMETPGTLSDKINALHDKGLTTEGGGYISQNPLNKQIEQISLLTDKADRIKGFQKLLETTDPTDPMFVSVKEMAKINGVPQDVIDNITTSNGLTKFKELNNISGTKPSGTFNVATDVNSPEYQDWLKGAVEDKIKQNQVNQLTQATEASNSAAVNAPPTTAKLANVKTVFDEVPPEKYVKMSALNPKKLEMDAIIDEYKRAGFQLQNGGTRSFDNFINDVNSIEKYRIANGLPRSPEGIKQAFQIAGKDIGQLRGSAGGTANIEKAIKEASSYGADKFNADRVNLSQALRKEIQTAYPQALGTNPNLSAVQLGEVKSALQQYKTIFNQATGVDKLKLMKDPEFMTKIRLSDLVDDELNRIVGGQSGAQEAGNAYRIAMQQGEGVDKVINKIDPMTDLPVTHFQLTNKVGDFLGDKLNFAKERAGRLLQGKVGGTSISPGIRNQLEQIVNSGPASLGVNLMNSSIPENIGVGLLGKIGVTPQVNQVNPSLGDTQNTPTNDGISLADMGQTSDLDLRRQILQQAWNASGGNLSATMQIANYLMQGLQNKQNKLPAASVAKLADVNTAVKGLDQLEGIVRSNSGEFGPTNIGGAIRDLGGVFADPNRENIKTTIDFLTSTLVKALSGTAASDKERSIIRNMLPQMTDNPEVAIQKLNAVRQLLSNQSQGYQTGYETAGYSPDMGSPDLSLASL